MSRPVTLILDPGVPGAPRTETAVYGDARAPFAAPIPELPMSDDAISDLVHNALSRSDDFGALLGSRLHVRAAGRVNPGANVFVHVPPDRVLVYPGDAQ